MEKFSGRAIQSEPTADTFKKTQITPFDNINEKEQLAKITTSSSLQEILEKLLNEIKQIIQNIQLPQDQGKLLRDSAMNEELVGASDGSVITTTTGETKGGYSFSLQDYNSNKKRMVGQGNTPQSNEINSLTAEMYGLIGSMLCTLLIIKKYPEDDFSTAAVTFTSDNLQSI